MALLLEMQKKNDTVQAIFKMLDDAKKIQVYLKLVEKEADPSWIWAQFGDHRQNTPRWARQSLDAIVFRQLEDLREYGIQPKVPTEVRAAYRLYKDKVGLKLAAAFRNDVKQPHMTRGGGHGLRLQGNAQ
eukprot:6320742-Prymnesium_polylepis.1